MFGGIFQIGALFDEVMGNGNVALGGSCPKGLSPRMVCLVDVGPTFFQQVLHDRQMPIEGSSKQWADTLGRGQGEGESGGEGGIGREGR